MAFKPIDPRRDEFRRYMENGGVIEAMTKIFVRIVQERPENPLEFLTNNLGDTKQQADKVAFLEKELKDAQAEIRHLREILKSLDANADKKLNEEIEKVTTELQQQKISEEIELGNNENVDGSATIVISEATARTDVEQSEFANKESLEDVQQNDCNSKPSTATQSATNNIE